MKALIKLFLLGTLVLGVHNSEIETSLLPKLDDWWGTEESKCDYNTEIHEFKVKFDDEMITDLLKRLKNHRKLTPPLEGATCTYGFNTDAVYSWVDYWTNKYNFKEREAYLNQFPHFKTNIQGINMHFIWVKPKVPEGVKVVPLLLLHGWPGSIREFYKAIPLITAYNPSRGYAVEVIVPSLPGFGFSGAAVRPGLGGTEMAVVLRNLMHRLGFFKYFIQGGDWGAHICNSIATEFPDEVLGYHTNYPVSFAPGTIATWIFGSLSPSLQSLVVDSSEADRLYPLLDILKNLVTETGYLHVQATKPDGIGVGLGDSPVGLLTYILMIMSMASRSDFKYTDDGGIDQLFTRDEVIDNIMIYWSNNAMTTAMRIYAETFNIRNVKMLSFAKSTPVPTCTIHAKDELVYQSPAMLKFKFTNLLNSTILEDYGHFLALEQPDLFSESVLSCIDLIRSWRQKPHYKNEL